jgi:hypothetical protein
MPDLFLQVIDRDINTSRMSWHIRDVLLSEVETTLNQYASALALVSSAVVIKAWVLWKWDILGNNNPTGSGILSQTGLVLCTDNDGNYHNLIIPALSPAVLDPLAIVPYAIAYPTVSQEINDALVAAGACSTTGSPFQTGMIVVKAGG